MPSIDQYLGKGIIFPVELSPSGSAVIRGGPDLIKSSIFMILSWPKNHRIFLNEFGSRLEELLEEPNDELLKGLVEYFVIDSLRDWEKRIILLDSVIERMFVEKLDVKILYRIKASGFEDTLTFPFYRNIPT